MAVWLTTMEPDATVTTLYERQQDVTVTDAVFTIALPVNSIVTVRAHFAPEWAQP